ncbi:MAG: hypothetical protein ABI435_02145 [Pseudolysinimonas sp.]
MPNFEGPWASEFHDYYVSARSDFERDALRDGEISDQEYAEMTTRMSDCLKAQGIEFSGFAQGGGYEIQFPPSMGSEQANQLTNDCSQSSGEWSVGALHQFVQANPDKVDLATAIAACLVARKAVASGYTAEDWRREDRRGRYSFIVDKHTGLSAVAACNSDPMGSLPG